MRLPCYISPVAEGFWSSGSKLDAVGCAGCPHDAWHSGGHRCDGRYSRDRSRKPPSLPLAQKEMLGGYQLCAMAAPEVDCLGSPVRRGAVLADTSLRHRTPPQTSGLIHWPRYRLGCCTKAYCMFGEVPVAPLCCPCVLYSNLHAMHYRRDVLRYVLPIVRRFSNTLLYSLFVGQVCSGKFPSGLYVYMCISRLACRKPDLPPPQSLYNSVQEVKYLMHTVHCHGVRKTDGRTGEIESVYGRWN